MEKPAPATRRHQVMRACALLLIVVASACAPGGVTTSPTPAPSPLGAAALKYRIVDRLGALAFCDPDFYPVARADEQALADARFTAIQSDAPTFTAILGRLSIAPAATYTAEQRLRVYRDWKMLNALRLEPAGGVFRFVGVFAGSGSTAYVNVEGAVDSGGTVTVLSSRAGIPPACPICLARGTRIATPSGEVAVEDLRSGDVVWSEDGSGSRLAVPIAAVGRVPAATDHEVVRLALADGRSVDVSPGHPTADGRRVAALRAGDLYDGAAIFSAARVRYENGWTFDVLPASPRGIYWANGIRLGSTLAR